MIASLTFVSETMEALEVVRAIFADPSRAFTVKLWDGSTLPAYVDRAPGSALVLHDASAVDALLAPISEKRLAEAYIDSRIDVEGDLPGLLTAACVWSGPPLVPSVKALASRVVDALHSTNGDLAARPHGRRHAPDRDRRAIHHHYDQPNDFYSLFLDDSLTYSCAYFPTGDETLEEAQRAKNELICRKLGLEPGERVLDVGCGAGAFLAHAAKAHGVVGTGITLSETQLQAAKNRVSRERLGGSIELELLDYRSVGTLGHYDKIASVGMMEHVGSARLYPYFETLSRALRPGGLCLNHAIADISAHHGLFGWARRFRGGFIQSYIFPDSELVPIERVIREAERAGFEVRDLESLREHYAKTLRDWLRRLDDRHIEATMIVGMPAVRAFRLYFAASAIMFELGRISVFQLLLAKRSSSGRVESLPRSRADWYERARPSA